jgi:hypothetical protein
MPIIRWRYIFVPCWIGILLFKSAQLSFGEAAQQGNATLQNGTILMKYFYTIIRLPICRFSSFCFLPSYLFAEKRHR